MKVPEMSPVDPAAIENMVLALGAIGGHSGTGVCRTAYSPEWVAGQKRVETWAREAGLDVRTDAVGNLWARAEGAEAGPVIVTGSHIDSQRAGGRYDGALGVISGLVALQTLTATFGAPRRTLELVSLCEEEGSRFPSAGFWGSRAIVGKSAPADCDTVQDAAGQTIGSAMRDVGLDPAQIGTARRDDIAAFIELHIEQGPVLEDANLPVAIVDAITHIRQTEVTLTGVSNHAGAFPMDLRADPMAAFAEIAAAVIGHAEALQRPAVTTVGRCDVIPNAGPIIPKSVTFTIDARHPDETSAMTMYAVHDRIMDEVAARRGVSVDRRVLIDLPACPSDPALLEALQNAADTAGIQNMRMASGAGHDAQQMARICPIAMIFVRSKDGRSHTPEEFSSAADIAAGTDVLIGALYRLAYLPEDADASRDL
ncbi:MAG: Zn-dependent hydrolase [Pseudomonadota bacterium]